MVNQKVIKQDHEARERPFINKPESKEKNLFQDNTSNRDIIFLEGRLDVVTEMAGQGHKVNLF